METVNKSIQTDKILIFLPRNITKTNFCYLSGEIDRETEKKHVVYFITGTYEQKPDKPCLGVWTTSLIKPALEQNLLGICKGSDGKITVKSESNDEVPKILVLYDNDKWHSHDMEESPGDLFVKLKEKLATKKPKPETNFLALEKFLKLCLKFFLVLVPILKYSSTALQLKTTIERFLWAITRKGVKARNFYSSVILDVIFGLICLHFLLTLTSTSDFPDLFLWISEQCVNGLRNLLLWLAGSPAGFKLNKQLNNILAKFFVFYTDIWWIFLVLISPVLGLVFRVFIFLGQFGFTFQAAIASDILALVTFHAYCIYAFAARLYAIQLSGLISLWRLFLGRKWNPLRNKVDSCQYSAEQLFVGTLVFTILLFLLPTALIYYVVFTTMRLFIVGLGGVLTRIRTIIHAVPIYSTFLWLISASSISTQTYMEPDFVSSTSEVMVVNARRVPDSYIATVKNTLPDFVDTTSAATAELIHILLTGQLLCPI